MLKNKLVIRFQELHLEKYNQTINYEEAALQLKELANLVRLTTKGRD